MKKILLVAFLVTSLASQAQLGDLLNKARGGGKVKYYPEDTANAEIFKKHVGEVLFSNEECVPTLDESKYIKTYKLGDPLYVRAFYPHSPINTVMAELEASGMTPLKINQSRDQLKQNVQVDFRLLVDGKQINWTTGGKPEAMLSMTSYAAKLNDNTDAPAFGKNLYEEILKKKSQLTPGVHKLKIEVRPYYHEEDIKYQMIAVGEIDLIIPVPPATEATCWPYKAYSDPALEAEILKAVKKSKPNAFKVVLNSKEKVNRAEYTNAIISKTVYAYVVSKTAEKVTYDVYIMEREFDGSGYLPADFSKDPENYLLPKDIYVNKDCLKYLK
jgi:hypothetical protein